MVKSLQVRRVLIFGLALSLLGIGPVPLSACALLTSRLAECANPETNSHCNGMDMGESTKNVPAVGSSDSCCSSSRQPAVQLQSQTPDCLTIPYVTASYATAETPRAYAVPFASALVDSSPPPLQSLLCTFLT